jgi:hypothetical protein
MPTRSPVLPDARVGGGRGIRPRCRDTHVRDRERRASGRRRTAVSASPIALPPHGRSRPRVGTRERGRSWRVLGDPRDRGLALPCRRKRAAMRIRRGRGRRRRSHPTRSDESRVGRRASVERRLLRPGRLSGIGRCRWRRDRALRLGSGSGRGSGCRRRGLPVRLRRPRRRPGRQEAEWVDIAVLVGGHAHAEMHVRLHRHGVGARPDHPDRVALGDHPALVDEQRPELAMGNRVAVRRQHRDHESLTRHGTGERDLAAGSRPHSRSDRAADVEAAVLPARVRVAAQGELPQHGSLDGPRPGRRGRRDEGQHDQGDHQHPTHDRSSLRCRSCQLREV